MKTPQWVGNGDLGNGSMANRSPKDRGSADAYYGRGCQPHKIVDNIRHDGGDITDEEWAEYVNGYENETDRKQWE